MRRALVLAVVAGLAASAAWADVLVYAAGGKREGALDEITVFVDGMNKIYLRDDIATVTVSKTGKDVVKLQGGKTVEGKLGSVRFNVGEGVLAVPRAELRSVEVAVGTKAEEWTPEPKEAEEPETPPEAELTAEQQQALAKNLELYKGYKEKAEEQRKKDIEAFSKRYKSDWDSAVRDVSSYEKRIDDKIRRRDQASRRYEPDSRYRSEYDRLLQTDQLDQDRASLEKAKRKVSQMKSMLKKGRDDIDEAADLREKRVVSVAKGIRGDILSGKIPNEEQMIRRYDAAIKVTPSTAKKK